MAAHWDMIDRGVNVSGKEQDEDCDGNPARKISELSKKETDGDREFQHPG